jgi:uncharacterized protein (TIGR02391 family)
MATLLAPRQEVRQTLETRIRAGKDLVAKAERAEATGGHGDWLELVAKWRDETEDQLNRLYADPEVGRVFASLSGTTKGPTPALAFPVAKTYHGFAVTHLQSLIDRLELAVEPLQEATAIESLHPEILLKCRKLYESGVYSEAVEKSFKIVRDRLRVITGYETGAEAFGKGSLYIDGAAASHVDDDFQSGVKFLAMAIDRFRNEKSHNADGNISDPIRAYEYLRLSSLAMHLLEGGRVRSSK